MGSPPLLCWAPAPRHPSLFCSHASTGQTCSLVQDQGCSGWDGALILPVHHGKAASSCAISLRCGKALGMSPWLGDALLAVPAVPIQLCLAAPLPVHAAVHASVPALTGVCRGWHCRGRIGTPGQCSGLNTVARAHPSREPSAMGASRRWEQDGAPGSAQFIHLSIPCP